jgi:hypothetical protein
MLGQNPTGFGPTVTQYFNINDSVNVIVGPKYRVKFDSQPFGITICESEP